MSEKIIEISFEETKKLLESEKNCVLLDVREESEFCVSHAEGAQCLPVDSIDEKTAKFVIGNFETPVICYCKSGSRAELASNRLAQLGYKRIYNLGSLVGWPYAMSFGAY